MPPLITPTVMKYSININQKAAIDLGLKLDIVDLAIFDYIKDFSASKASSMARRPCSDKRLRDS